MILKGTNMSMHRGDSESFTAYLEDKKTKALLPFVTGDTVYFTIKKSIHTSEIVLQKVITVFQDGKAPIKIEPIDTQGLPYMTFVYDVQVTKADGWKNTFLDGEFTLLGEVTYD